MEFLQQWSQWMHPVKSTAVTLSGLDIFLFTLKNIVSLTGSMVLFTGAMIGLHRFLILHLQTTRAKKLGYDVDFIRRDLGRTIVLGLEFIIAADIIETTTTPDYYSLGILGIIVIVRTFLSYALNKEISSLAPAEKKKFGK